MVVGLLILRDIGFPVLGVVGGVVILARTAVGRRFIASVGGRAPSNEEISQPQEHLARLEAALDDAQERLDVAEHMLAESRRRITSPVHPSEVTTPV